MQNKGTYTRIGENEFMVADNVNLDTGFHSALIYSDLTSSKMLVTCLHITLTFTSDFSYETFLISLLILP